MALFCRTMGELWRESWGIGNNKVVVAVRHSDPRKGPATDDLRMSCASHTIVVNMSATALTKSYHFNTNDEESLGTRYNYCKNVLRICKTNPCE